MFEEMVANGFVVADYVFSGPLEDLYNIFIDMVENGIAWEILGSEG